MKKILVAQATEDQKKQVKRFAEDAVDKAFAEASFDKNSIQKLIYNGSLFQADVAASVKRWVSIRFIDG